MGRIVIQHVIEDALIAAIIDRGENAEGSIIELIGSHIPGKIRQGPIKEVRIHARLRLFSPPLRPSSGSSRRAQRRGGHATGATSLGGRASRPRPPAAPPDPAPGGGPDCLWPPDRTGLHSRACATRSSMV